MIVDLADPRVRAVAVAAAVRSLTMATALCPDRSRIVAGRMIDDVFAAIGNHAITEGEVPLDACAAS